MSPLSQSSSMRITEGKDRERVNKGGSDTPHRKLQLDCLSSLVGGGCCWGPPSLAGVLRGPLYPHAQTRSTILSLCKFQNKHVLAPPGTVQKLPFKQGWQSTLWKTFPRKPLSDLLNATFSPPQKYCRTFREVVYKGWFIPKWEFFHDLFAFMLMPTCVTFFLL